MYLFGAGRGFFVCFFAFLVGWWLVFLFRLGRRGFVVGRVGVVFDRKTVSLKVLEIWEIREEGTDK